MLTLTCGSTRVQVDPDLGGRLTTLEVAGRQLLMPAPPGATAIYGGCYPMVPWAGRVRNGRFTVDGHEVQLEIDAPPHAIHGLAYDRPWTVTDTAEDRATLTIDLAAPAMIAAGWPFGGLVTQTVTAEDDGVALTMEVTAATTAVPVVIGWHPWFLRGLEDGVEGQAVFDAEAMLVRGDDGLPTGERVPVPPGPWDDCMVGVRGTPQVRWPGIGAVAIDSDLDHLVVYDGYPDGVCVEPQSGPPDAFNLALPLLAPGQTVRGAMRLRWQDDPAAT